MRLNDQVDAGMLKESALYCTAYNDAGLTQKQGEGQALVFEFFATAAGTVLFQTVSDIRVMLAERGADFCFNTFRYGGNHSTASYAIVGYGV